MVIMEERLLSISQGRRGDASQALPPQDRSDPAKAAIDHEWVQGEMVRSGVTMTLPWNERAERAVLAGRTPNMHSSFCHRHQRRVDANPELAIHVEWRPGEWTQVDWRGDAMRVCDPDAREPPKAYALVISLPFSAYVLRAHLHFGPLRLRACASRREELSAKRIALQRAG